MAENLKDKARRIVDALAAKPDLAREVISLLMAEGLGPYSHQPPTPTGKADSMEVGVLIATDGSVLTWHLPPGSTGASLPDSRDLWEVIWESRDRLAGFAHSHPGAGVPAPSWTDVTTFAAIEEALGKRLTWWITSEDRLIAVKWRGPSKHEYARGEVRKSDPLRSETVQELRERSYGPREA